MSILLDSVLILTAIFFFYLAFRLILKFFPDLISRERVLKLEDLARLDNLCLVVTDKKFASKAFKSILAAKLITRLNLISFLLGHEQRKQYRLEVKQFHTEFGHLLMSANWSYCSRYIQACIESLDTLSNQSADEFDYNISLNKIKHLQWLLSKGQATVQEIELKLNRINQEIDQLWQNQDESTVEVIGSITEGFGQIVNDLNSSMSLTSTDFLNINFQLDQLQQIIDQLGLSGSTQTAVIDDWVDYYELLGLSFRASEPEIKKAYRQKIGECHPDKKQSEVSKLSDPEIIAIVQNIFNEKVIQLRLAYETLSNPATKNKYDEIYQIRKGGHSYV